MDRNVYKPFILNATKFKFGFYHHLENVKVNSSNNLNTFNVWAVTPYCVDIEQFLFEMLLNSNDPTRIQMHKEVNRRTKRIILRKRLFINNNICFIYLLVQFDWCSPYEDKKIISLIYLSHDDAILVATSSITMKQFSSFWNKFTFTQNENYLKKNGIFFHINVHKIIIQSWRLSNIE